MTKITDEELAREMWEEFIAENPSSGFCVWENTGHKKTILRMARRARELLQSSWPDPIPIVTGEEVTYPCLAAEAGQWWILGQGRSPEYIKAHYSHFIPMPPAPVVDPFEEWLKGSGEMQDKQFVDAGKAMLRKVWDAALKSKEAKC